MRQDSKLAYVGAFGVGNCGDDFLISAFVEERKPDLLVGIAALSLFDHIPFLTIEDASISLRDHDVTVCGGSFIWSVEQLQNLIEIAYKARSNSNRFDIRSVHIEHNTVCVDPKGFSRLAEYATTFTVRDSASAQRANDFGLQLLVERDPLAKMIAKNFKKPIEQKPSHPFTIAFNFHGVETNHWDWYYQFLAALNHYAGDGVCLKYVVHCRHLRHWPANEMQIAEYLNTRFHGKLIATPPAQSSAELANHYNLSDIFVSNRSHGLLLAEALDVPAAAIGGSIAKSDAIARDCGIPIYYLNEEPVQAAARFAKTLKFPQFKI